MRIDRREFQDRLHRVKVLMERERYDALIAYASRIQYGMVRYLTGYEPWVAPEEWAFAMVTPGYGSEISLLSNSPWDFWEFNRTDSTWVSDLVVGSHWVKSLSERLPASARRVAIAGWYGFPAPVYLGLAEQFPNTRFEDATGLLREIRAVKSEAEIALLREAGGIADEGGRSFIEAVVPGVSEREVAARVDAVMMRNGADKFGYHTILGGGRKTMASCFYPTHRALEAGEIVQLDCAPMLEGYKADFSRLMIPGQGSARTLRLVDTVAEMFERCAERLRPGVTCEEVAQAGLDVALANGYTRENLFVSANYPGVVVMGHGIGLDNPDPPGMISTGNPAILQENMVMNIEPILVDPEVGGGRIEGAFVVTPQGPVSLSTCEIRPWRVPQAQSDKV
jgi:Xaa-Pro aminopeptidase